MAQNFWEKLNKPFGETQGKPLFVLAPLYHVTDFAFREIIAKYGKPDVMFTEFVSADGLASRGKDNLMHFLKYSEIQRPISAQIFGVNPENFYTATRLIKELGFDGVDINFGCPDKNVVKVCAGAGVIKDPDLAKEVVLATKEAAGDLPVSIKTRTGYSSNIVEEWSEFLLKLEPAALTIHARTKKEMSKVPADWNSVAKAVQVRNKLKVKTLILGNGDVVDIDDAQEKIKKSGADGAMLGRAIFGNPWRFNKTVKKEQLTINEILEVLLEHTKLFEETVGKHRPYDLMKKHFASYISGFENIKELKMDLMETKSSSEVEKVIKDYLNKK